MTGISKEDYAEGASADYADYADFLFKENLRGLAKEQCAAVTCAADLAMP